MSPLLRTPERIFARLGSSGQDIWAPFKIDPFSKFESPAKDVNLPVIGVVLLVESRVSLQVGSLQMLLIAHRIISPHKGNRSQTENEM